MVRARFAPSPTGYLHIGNARTAVFNYLFVRKHRGKFILRVEDTDKERSKTEYEKALLEDLRWLGVDWDEGPDVGGEYQPYRQSGRLAHYRRFAQKLLEGKKVYKCFCTREELEERNKQAKKEGKSTGYDNRCRDLTDQQIEKYRREGRKYVLRLKVPDEKIIVDDLIRGKVEFEGNSIPDFIIMKPDDTPTFNFAVVVDDYLMKITHVIRGEDHLSNTPKHIAIFHAIGAQVPQFAHMSMTMGPDRTRLSKRHGATSVRAYRQEGFLPEAFLNYISLLGWGTTESQEIFDKEELIKEFSLERCNKSSAVFDPKKLLWMNGLYIRKTSPEKLFEYALPFLTGEKTIPLSPSAEKKEYVTDLIALEKEKLKTLKDIPYRLEYFFKEPAYEEKGVKKYLLNQEGQKILRQLFDVLKECQDFTHQPLELLIQKFCEDNSYKFGQVFHPLRVAVSGRTKGPGVFHLLEKLGKEKVLERIEKAAGIEEKIKNGEIKLEEA
jgi:glutamyl-tRNA synthetase